VDFYVGGSGSTGEIFARKIAVSQSGSFQLTYIGFLPSGELTLHLTGVWSNSTNWSNLSFDP
jgi:hypothetical protein